MIINIINTFILSIFLIYSYKKPISGIICLLIIILSVPTILYAFGLSFGSGDKYLPNLTIVVAVYTLLYFLKAESQGKIEIFDLCLVVYLLAVAVFSFYASEFTANIGVIVKIFVTPILFYFVGKVFVFQEETLEKNYLRLRKYLLFLGPYFIILALLEYMGNINIFPLLLDRFASLVGASENFIFDPVAKYESMVNVAYHRLMGPLFEPTETALVVMVIFIGYLLWTDGTTWRKYRIITLITLLAMIVLSTSRSVILATLAVIGMRYALDYRNHKIGLCGYICIVMLLAVIIHSGVGEEFLQQERNYHPFFDRIAEERTVLGRFEAINDAWDLAKDHLLLGIGMGTEVGILPKIEEGSSTLTVHNFYLDNLLFKGVITSAGLMVIYLIIIRRSYFVFARAENRITGNIALTHLLLTAGMLTFYLTSQEKLQIASLFWFYSGMIRGIKLPRGV